MEDQATAAAILVQTLISSDDRLRVLLQQQTQDNQHQENPEGTANFLKPWYAAMLKMVSSAATLKQSAT